MVVCGVSTGGVFIYGGAGKRPFRPPSPSAGPARRLRPQHPRGPPRRLAAGGPDQRPSFRRQLHHLRSDGRLPRRHRRVRHRPARPGASVGPTAFKNLTARFLSNDDFPEAANQQAAPDLTTALAAAGLHYPIAARYPLERIVEAHQIAARADGAGRVVLDLWQTPA